MFFSFFIETLTQRMFIQQLNLDDCMLTTKKSKSKCIRDIIKEIVNTFFLQVHLYPLQKIGICYFKRMSQYNLIQNGRHIPLD